MVNTSNLAGKMVKHKSLGEGKIVSIDAAYIYVAFTTKTSKFKYPDAFEEHLDFEDPKLQEKVLQLIREKKDAEEAERLEKERKREEERKRQEFERLSVSQKLFVPHKRSEETVLTFYCNHWIYYEPEVKRGILWAPLYAADGRSLYYWDNLLNVREGDIIIDGSEGFIRAISRAKGSCYDLRDPFLKESVPNNREGRAVNCDYTILENPIPTANYRDEIIKRTQVKYAPFDKNGDGNAGYLFDLDKELASIFLQGIIEKNPTIGNLDYIQWLL